MIHLIALLGALLGYLWIGFIFWLVGSLAWGFRGVTMNQVVGVGSAILGITLAHLAVTAYQSNRTERIMQVGLICAGLVVGLLVALAFLGTPAAVSLTGLTVGGMVRLILAKRRGSAL